MTSVYCCGCECGVFDANNGAHWSSNSGTAPTFDNVTFRNGARSLRIHATPGTCYATSSVLASSNVTIIRAYIFFSTLPSANSVLIAGLLTSDGANFKASDSKIYAGAGTGLFGATGVSVTTGVWYRLDIRIDSRANPNLIDVSVNGVACGQASNALAATAETQIIVGNAGSLTTDFYVDDIVISQTLADFPIGDGFVNHFIPTSDGTHNVAGANDFERSATGTDITNATTNAFDLINDVPLKSGTISEYINLVAPPNATDYVEVVFGAAPGISTPTVAPRAIDAIITKAKGTGTGVNNLRIALNDNGTTNDIFNGDTTTASPTATFARKHYATAPTGGAWTVVSGAGNFNNLRMRCFTSDAAPDPWWASAMIEAEFAPLVAAIPNKIHQCNQAINRASTY